MPAVTIVAACISEETGVGPAMASGSQTWNGNWALLPMAPMNRASPAQKATRMRAPSSLAIASSTSLNRNEPTVTPTMITPMIRPTSATLLAMNALMAAALFSWSSHQCPRRR